MLPPNPPECHRYMLSSRQVLKEIQKQMFSCLCTLALGGAHLLKCSCQCLLEKRSKEAVIQVLCRVGIVFKKGYLIQRSGLLLFPLKASPLIAVGTDSFEGKGSAGHAGQEMFVFCVLQEQQLDWPI